MLRSKSVVEKEITYLLLKKLFKEKMTVTLPLREILFDGYDDPLLKLAGTIGIKNIPFDKFAFFYQVSKTTNFEIKLLVQY